MTLRVLFVGLLPPRPGGASVSLGQLVAGLAQAGVEIAAIAPITAATMLDGGDWYAARHPRLRVYRYLMDAYITETYRPLPPETAERERGQIMCLAMEVARAFEPDVLVAGHETTGGYVRELAEQLGLPWCQLLRGTPTGQILAGTFAAERVAGYIDQFRAADGIVAVAEFMARGLEQQYGIRGIRAIANAIDLELFRPRPKSPALLARLAIAPAQPVILCPGNLIERKRPMDVLEAFADLAATHPDVVLVCAGEGRLEPELRAYCAARGIEDRVRFLGWVPNAEMPALMNVADIVVMASASEGMARTYIEAMASGVALVASAIPSSRELILDGINGRLFPVGDHAALAGVLAELLAEPERRAEIAEAGRARVADRHIDAAVQAYVEELEGLRRRRPSHLPLMAAATA
jgi:glycosyltransferase involved in cell wall biosynthesis